MPRGWTWGSESGADRTVAVQHSKADEETPLFTGGGIRRT
jgi:hypothetical protein